MFMPDPTPSTKLKNSNSSQASNKILAKALYDYSARKDKEGELSYKKGAVLTIIQQDADGWWAAELDGKQGWVSSMYMQLIPNNQRTLPKTPLFEHKGQTLIKINDNDVLNTVETGDVKKIEQMPLTSNHLMLKDVKGNTLFMSALFFENFEMASWLLEKKSSFLEEKNRSGQTPLIYFKSLNQHRVVEWLYEYLPEAKMAAAKPTVPTLLSKNQTSDPSQAPKKISMPIKSILKKPAEKREMTNLDILIAVEQGDLNSIQQLDINNLFKQRDNEGHTLFMHALWFEQFEIAKWLKQRKQTFLQEKNTANLTPLIWLVCLGKLTAIEWILTNGASWEEKDGAGNSLLMIALNNERYETAAWLIQNNSKFLQEKDGGGLTPLIRNVCDGKLKQVQWLVAHGAKYREEKDSNGNSIFMIALANKKYEVARWLFEKKPEFMEGKDKFGNDIRFWLANNNYSEALNWLDENLIKPLLGLRELEPPKPAQINKPQVNTPPIPQTTAISPVQLSVDEVFAAARKGNLDKIRHINKYHPSLNHTDQQGNNLLKNALYYNHFNLADWLIQVKPLFLTEKDSNGDSVFIWAARYPKLEIMDWLYEKRPSFIREEFQNQLTPMTWAAAANEVSVMLWLNNHGIALVEKNSAGGFPLIMALMHDQKDAAVWLIKNGVSIQDNVNGHNLLIEMLIWKKYEMAEWLLQQRPAFLQDRDHLNNTVLMTLLNDNCIHGAEWILLKDQGLLRREGNNQHTPMSFFAGKGSIEIMKWLYSKGASLTEKTSKNNSPYEVACQHNKTEVMTWLEKQGAKPKVQPAAASAPPKPVYSAPAAARHTMYAPQQHPTTRVIYVNQPAPQRNTYAENMNATANLFNAVGRFENGLANDVNAFNNAFNP